MITSVIIPAYNQDELIKFHVQFCMASSNIPDEIIVINDGGSDTLKNVLLTINKETKLIYAKIEEDVPWNQVGARNLGVWLSKGDLLAMEDADHFPDKDFYRLASYEIAKGADMVLATKRYSLWLEDLKKGIKEVKGKRGTHKFVSLMHRNTYLKMKGFDERFAGHYGWDVPDWRRRFQKAGLKYGQVGSYYHIEDGKANIKRRTDSNNQRYPEAENYRFLKENTADINYQHPKGILNFRYTWEIL